MSKKYFFHEAKWTDKEVLLNKPRDQRSDWEKFQELYAVRQRAYTAYLAQMHGIMLEDPKPDPLPPNKTWGGDGFTQVDIMVRIP